MHTQHHWEGVVLDYSEFRKYNKDKESLLTDFFIRVEGLDGNDDNNEESESKNEIMSELLQNKIIPYTLRQGKFIKLNIIC